MNQYYCVVMLIISVSKATGEDRCTRCELPNDAVVRNVRLENSTFSFFYNMDLVDCGIQCLARHKCYSFNFNEDSKRCELNSANLNTASGIYKVNYVYGDVMKWPMVGILIIITPEESLAT